jgi:hypothetical protein
VEPEKSLLHFFLLAFFLIRVREPAPLSGFWAGLILHLILHFSQKVAIFAPKRAFFLLFVPTLFFGFRAVFPLQASSKISGQTSLH